MIREIEEQMMSPMLANIIEALKIIDSMGYPSKHMDTPYLNLNNLAFFDNFRATFFSDTESQLLFDWLCKYRIIVSAFGHDAYAIPGAPITFEEWERLKERAQAMTEGFAKGDYLIDRIDTWLLESYRLAGRCEVEQGDIVLDCGAHVGSTALYFSQKAGDAGHVYAFEPMPEEFKLLTENVGRLSNVSPVNAAVLDAKGIREFSVRGAASQVANGNSKYPIVPVYTVSLDDFVFQQGLKKVDFIKMDIEGGEAAALKGAKRTITAFKPKMAISVYHKAMDIVELPMMIKEILPHYSFSLRHFTHKDWETVLYCYFA